ncbi:MAG TPA: dihydroorotase [Armatimonadota bacterium]|jgi:dihydroorotase
MADIHLKNGRIIDPAQDMDRTGDILIRDGRIAVGAPSPGARVVDCKGKVIAPGFVDLHVHLREPGQEHKETIATGTRAAAAGGFTTVCCMPNTTPMIDNAAMVRDILAKAKREGVVRVAVNASVIRDYDETKMAEMADMAEAGAVAMTDDAFPIQDSERMRLICEYLAPLDRVLILHCEDKALTRKAVMHEGRVSSTLGLAGMPAFAEESTVARNIALAEAAGCRLHIAHISTAGAVETVRQAKARGAAVTAEACPHHFALTDEAVAGYDTNAKMNPPLRSAADVEAVKQGLADGTIDCIATDHAPHAHQEKETPFADAPFGIVGLETALGLTLKELVTPGYLTLYDAIAKLTVEPVGVLTGDHLAVEDLDVSWGTLVEGAPADVVVFDPEAEWTVEPQAMLTKSKNTPFGGWTLPGKVALTICGGEIAYEGN